MIEREPVPSAWFERNSKIKNLQSQILTYMQIKDFLLFLKNKDFRSQNIFP